ncbi:hypothetical protein [Xanthomonas sacchari]|uniref:Uncharacterized protein n=1 Tax=Xanthomonas sacchari TaxID=56458 RepID=A0AA46PUI8_9XANT|nr:hypothetical protein [Xanthomonas sacchari]MCW0366360.1 hypothetical protein [Xanthomonas sacchari]MCW0440615.1 hypothetical protein [Xanthomonas sacchari]UYK87284.1 hypothetical protein NG824_12275 [Xanthomonas sacchari]
MEQRNGKQTAAWPQQRAYAQGTRHVLDVHPRQGAGQGAGEICRQADSNSAQDASGWYAGCQGGEEDDAGIGSSIHEGTCIGKAGSTVQIQRRGSRRQQTCLGDARRHATGGQRAAAQGHR